MHSKSGHPKPPDRARLGNHRLADGSEAVVGVVGTKSHLFTAALTDDHPGEASQGQVTQIICWSQVRRQICLRHI